MSFCVGFVRCSVLSFWTLSLLGWVSSEYLGGGNADLIQYSTSASLMDRHCFRSLGSRLFRNHATFRGRQTVLSEALALV